MSALSTSSVGAEAFDQHFAALYGERWPALRASLLIEPRKHTLLNPFSQDLQNYILDEASLVPVKHLAAAPGQRVADFCASPGGKSLASIFALGGEGEWFCNDLSPNRVARLKAVFFDCLPEQVRRKVRISRGDASLWGQRYRAEFDRILVDAPCSGERHLLESPVQLERWSLKGSKRLAIRQHSLLCSALDSLKPGGRLVYSTCSIHELENDGVIAKLKKSRAGLFQVVPIKEELGEATEHGWIILPDRCACGPIYFSVLERQT